MPGYAIKVKHVESGQEFSSIQAAESYFKIPRYRIDGTLEFLPGYTFEKIVEDAPPECVLHVKTVESETEEFKSIPGYEGLYSISTKGTIVSDKFPGRVKKVTTTKAGQHVIVLSKNSVPCMYTVESLYNLTWYGTPLKDPRFKRNNDRAVKHINKNRTFSSIKECCQACKIDYAKFIKCSKDAGKNGVFVCNKQSFKFI